MNTRKSMAAALAATMCFGLAGCGSKETKQEDKELTATITVWTPQEDQSNKWIQGQCEAFAKKHPKWKITFKYGVCSEGDAGKTVAQDVNAAADVYMFANDQLGQLIDAKGIAQLGGSTAEEIKKTNSDPMVKSVTSDGKIYGVPFTGNTWFMYYDTSAFTADDVKSLDAMLKKATVAFPLTNSWYNGSFYLANGGSLFGDGTDASKGIDFKGEKGYATTKYLINLVNNKNFVNDADGKALTGLRSGSVKAMFSGSWDYDNVKKALGDRFGAVQLPKVTIDGKEQQLKSFAGSKAIGVNPNSKHQEVAVALAKYLGSSESQKSHYETRKIIPCNTELLKDEKISKDPLIKAQNDTINNTSVIQPTITAMSKYWVPAETFGKAIVGKKVTAANYKEETDKFVKSLNTKETD